MTDAQIDGYFSWLCKRIDDGLHTNYTKLLYKLFTTPFFYFVEHDENRAADGISLRYTYSPEFKANYISPCNMLEMMVALADRIEAIMECPEYESRVSLWFWTMVDRAGLGSMNDILYDDGAVTIAMHRINYREYSSDGYGGLFCVRNHKGDFRQMELWYQMQQSIHEMRTYERL